MKSFNLGCTALFFGFFARLSRYDRHAGLSSTPIKSDNIGGMARA